MFEINKNDVVRVTREDDQLLVMVQGNKKDVLNGVDIVAAQAYIEVFQDKNSGVVDAGKLYWFLEKHCANIKAIVEAKTSQNNRSEDSLF